MPSEMTRLEKLEQQQAQIKNRIAAEKRKLSSQNRKARNHALMVIGGLVESHVGDWKSIDWDALAMYLETQDAALKQLTTNELEPTQAAARLRDWEKKGRQTSNDGQRINSAPARPTQPTGQPNYAPTNYPGNLG